MDPYNAVPPGSNAPISLRPFTAVNLDDSDDVLSWMTMAVEQLTEYYSPYRRLYRDNIATYIGLPKESGWAWQWDGSSIDSIKPVRPKTRLNIIQPIVESHLTRLTSSRANVSVLPVHSAEYKDLAAAKTVEKVIETSWRDRRIVDSIEMAARTMLVCGSSYIQLLWNPDIGPKLKEASMKGTSRREIPLIDDKGEPLKDGSGNPVVVPVDFRLGDVDYRVLRPDQVLEQPSGGCRLEDKDWVIIIEVIDVYKLRERYPRHANEIKAGSWSPFTTEGSLYWTSPDCENQAVVFTLLHKATPSVPEGFQVVCTSDVVLEASLMPFPVLNEGSLLPLARLDDTVAPGYDIPLPLTVMEAGKSYQALFNGVNNNILRNLSLSSPKWLVAHNSGVRRAHLSNEASIVPYKGVMKPELVAPNFNHMEAFAYRDKLLEELRLNTGSAHSFNAPPPNTRAAEMLQHHEEQEFRRAEPLIRHMNDFQARMARIAVAIMASMYDEADGRGLRLFGPGGASVMLQLKVADLGGPYDVRFERTSALPDSKQGRINTAAMLYQLQLISKEQFRKVIGYDSDPDLQTPEAKAFEYQMFRNDLLRYGNQIAEPLEHEDHAESLKALYPIIMSVEYAEMPPEIKDRFVAETMAREMFAWKKAQTSPAMRTKLSTLIHFPCFFTALPGLIPAVDPMIAMQSQSILDAPQPAQGSIQPPQPPGPDSPELS